MNTYLVWSMANQYFVIKMTTTSSEAPKVYIEETKGKTTNKCRHCDFASKRADNLRRIPTPKWYLRKILRMIPANRLMMLIEYGVEVEWVNYQSKRYEPNKGKNQGREPASEFSFHKVEKWQKYFWRMIFSSTTYVSYFEE